MIVVLAQQVLDEAIQYGLLTGIRDSQLSLLCVN
jgi:hypothetical protein